jgi:hypothetical protein
MEVPVNVTIMEGANTPGRDMSPTILNFLGKVANIYGKNIQVQCGTNHNQYTTSGKISDHWQGDAADIYTYTDVHGINSPTGDNIARAAFIAAGVEPTKAATMCKIGALRNFFLIKNRRIQIIWRINNIDLGGDHTNHIHIGIRTRISTDPPEGTITELS